jgi:exoribonuclease R
VGSFTAGVGCLLQGGSVSKADYAKLQERLVAAELKLRATELKLQETSEELTRERRRADRAERAIVEHAKVCVMLLLEWANRAVCCIEHN